MSKQKKARKDRRPNIPQVSVSMAAVTGPGGGPATASAPMVERKAATAFDYTHVKKDLVRIGFLAGGFITILVVLSFFLK